MGAKATPMWGLEDPQLLCPIRCKVVERFGIGFTDIHIQIMVGDDVDAITGDVGRTQRITKPNGMKGNGGVSENVVSFGFWIGGFVGKAFDEFVVGPDFDVVGFEVFQPKTEGGMQVIVVSASILRITSLPINEIVDGDSIVGKIDEAVGLDGIATTQVDETFVFV